MMNHLKTLKERCREFAALVVCLWGPIYGGCAGARWTEQQGRKPGEIGHYILREFKVDQRPDRKMSYLVLGECPRNADGSQAEKPTLVFVPGIGGFKYFWSQLAILMTGQHGYRSVLVDLLGFGESDKPSDVSYSPEAQGDRLRQFIQNLRLAYHEKVVLVAESYGAATSLEAARDLCNSGDSNPIAGLFVCDPPAYYFWQLEDPAKRLCLLKAGLHIPAFTALASDYVFEWQNLEWAVWDESKIKEHDRIEVRRQFSSTDARLALLRTTIDMIEGLKKNKDDSQRYSCIDVPVRIIWGEKDRIVPIEVMQRLYGDLSTSPGRSVSCRVIQDCGHDALRDNPSEIADELIWFLHDDLKQSILAPLRPRTQTPCRSLTNP